jgi:hypothetical protein
MKAETGVTRPWTRHDRLKCKLFTFTSRIADDADVLEMLLVLVSWTFYAAPGRMKRTPPLESSPANTLNQIRRVRENGALRKCM